MFNISTSQSFSADGNQRGAIDRVYHTNIKPWLATLKMKGVARVLAAALRFQHSILDPPNKEENF